MRVLPRSAKGTWLLAGTIWSVAVVYLWALIPPFPKAIWTIPLDTHVIRLSADGQIVQTVERPAYESPFAVVSRQAKTPSYHGVGTVLAGTEGFEMACTSPDGRWLLLKKLVDGRKLFIVADIESGRLRALEFAPKQELPDGMMGEMAFDADFSADSQFLAISDRSYGILVWRLPILREATRFAQVDGAPVFSPDGRSVAFIRPAASETDDRCAIVIAEIDSGIETPLFQKPDRTGLLGFTSDRNGLICSVRIPSGGLRLQCNWLDGCERWDVPYPRCNASIAGSYVECAEGGDGQDYKVSFLDSNDGRSRHVLTLPASAFWFTHENPRTLVCRESPSQRPSIVLTVLRQLGLDWIGPTEGGRFLFIDVFTEQSQGGVPMQSGPWGTRSRAGQPSCRRPWSGLFADLGRTAP